MEYGPDSGKKDKIHVLRLISLPVNLDVLKLVSYVLYTFFGCVCSFVVFLKINCLLNC